MNQLKNGSKTKNNLRRTHRLHRALCCAHVFSPVWHGGINGAGIGETGEKRQRNK
jgi:hypothetical protein